MEKEETLLGHPAMPKYHWKLQFPMPRFRITVAFVVTVLLSGLLFYFIVFSLALHASSKSFFYGEDIQYATVTVTKEYPPPPLPTNLVIPPDLNVDGLLDMSPAELRAMIATTNGYLARDWSLYLGWNNVRKPCLRKCATLTYGRKMRYIIEAAILHARLLNRTLILPSFVYARACEYHK